MNFIEIFDGSFPPQSAILLKKSAFIKQAALTLKNDEGKKVFYNVRNAVSSVEIITPDGKKPGIEIALKDGKIIIARADHKTIEDIKLMIAAGPDESGALFTEPFGAKAENKSKKEKVAQKSEDAEKTGVSTLLAKAGRLIAWIISACLFILALPILSAGMIYASAVLLLMALAVTPPVLKNVPIFQKKHPVTKGVSLLLLGIIALIIGGLLSQPSSTPKMKIVSTEEQRAEQEERRAQQLERLRAEYEPRREKILRDAREAMKRKNYAKVEKLTDRYWVLEDKELNDLYAEARRHIVAKKEKGRAGAIKEQANKSGATDVEASVMATSVCEQRVRQHLKAPRTAKFPWRRNVTFDGEAATVISYVDAQNAFGAMLRTHYICAVKFLGGRPMDMPNWQITEFVVLD